MRLRRSLAVAAAVAVTMPVALLTAAPAFAAGASASQTQTQPTYAELEKAAADAQKAYDEAVLAQKKGRKEVEATLTALDSDTHPLKAAAIAAGNTAEDAEATRTAAEQAVTKAEAALEAAVSDADKAEARKALETAEAGLADAVGAEKEADAEAEEAQTALDDAKVAAVREYSILKEDLKKASEAKKAAAEALAAAKECVRESGLTSRAVGLPSEVVAGTTVDFTLRVTNGTRRTLTVDPLAFVYVSSGSKGAKGLLQVKWSQGSGWQPLGGERPEHIAHIDSLKPGERSVVKLRMKTDSGAGTTEAFALFASDAADAYRPCVLGPMKRYEFTLLPEGSKPDAVDDAEPGRPDGKDDDRSGTKAPGTGSAPSTQGGTSSGAVRSQVTATDTTGRLAETGASSATTPIALAGAVAVALGAGTVFTVRRRKAAADSA